MALACFVDHGTAEWESLPRLPLAAWQSLEQGLAVAATLLGEHGWEVLVGAASLIHTIYLAVGICLSSTELVRFSLEEAEAIIPGRAWNCLFKSNHIWPSI